MKKGKRFLSALLTAAMLLSISPLPVSAADGTQVNSGISNITGYNSTAGYDYVYYGTWNNQNVRWRVLSKNGNGGTYSSDGTDTVNENNAMFLLSEDALGDGSTYGGVYFQREYHNYNGTYHKGSNPGSDHTSCVVANVWQGSDAQGWCNTFYSGSLTPQEQSAVLATTKTDGAYPANSSGYSYEASALSGDRVFFLSAAEVETERYGFSQDDSGNDTRIANYNGTTGYWWLRSPSSISTDNAGLVSYYGYVYFSYVSYVRAARPAFNLNLESVLFISAAEGGKSADAGGVGPALTAYNYYGSDSDNANWKLTLKDSGRDDFSLIGTTAVSGNTLTVAYSGAETGNNEYISAIVTDSGGDITYYGRLANVMSENSASGTVQVTLPDGFNSSSDNLYLFNEQYNGNCRTDYGSDFQPVSLTKNAYTITNSLTNITSSNTAAFRQMSDSSDYTATLSVSGVYRLPESITVTVGETTLTSSAYTYNYQNGNLTIPASSITGDITITAAGVENKETKPNTQFTADSDSGGTLSGVDASMQYSLDNGNSWTTIQAADITDGSITLSNVTAANGIQVKRPGNGTTTADSDVQEITVTQATQPSGIDKVDCTTPQQNDGQITGVDSTMEYRLSTASDWTTITGNMLTNGNITGLTNGTYYVRVKAVGTALASPYAEVTIGEHTCTVDNTGWRTSETAHWHTCTCGNRLDQASHTYDKENTGDAYLATAATCTAQATYYYSCVCGAVGTDTFSYGAVNSGNHTNLVRIEAKAATSLEEGNIEYWHCDGCGKYFEDAAATEEITLADTVLPKLTDASGEQTEQTEQTETQKPTETPSAVADKTDNAAAPDTGDNANIAIWLVLLFVSGISVTVIIHHQKRRRSAK